MNLFSYVVAAGAADGVGFAGAATGAATGAAAGEELAGEGLAESLLVSGFAAAASVVDGFASPSVFAVAAG